MSVATRIRELVIANAQWKTWAVAGSDGLIAAALNTPSVVVHRRATSKQLLRWLAGNDRASKLRQAAASAENGSKAIAQSALYVVESGMEEVECDAEWWSMVDYLTTHPTGAPVLAAQDKADLETRIAETVSVAEADAQIGRRVTDADVSAALAGDRPNGRVGTPIGA